MHLDDVISHAAWGEWNVFVGVAVPEKNDWDKDKSNHEGKGSSQTGPELVGLTRLCGVSARLPSGGRFANPFRRLAVQNVNA